MTSEEAPGDPSGYALAFEEGRRAVDQQAETLRETRDRVGTLVSAAAVIAGLGATLAFNDQARVARLDWWGITATVTAALALAGAVLAAVMIWRPIAGVFSFDASMLVDSYVEGDPPAELPAIHRALAIHLGRHTWRNAGHLEWRLWWFSMALAAFVIEVVALLVVLLDVA